jgi:hypothetical protein
MKADPTSDPARNLQEEKLYDWATNPDNEVPGRCNMDPLMVQYGYVACTDDCSPPSGANSLCVKTPFAPAPEPAATCVPDRGSCVPGETACCSGVCEYGRCSSAARAEGFACSDSSQCLAPLTCLQGDWPVTTCGLSPGGVSGTIRLNGAGLGNVQVSASGVPYIVTTESSGNYTILGLASGEYIITPWLNGYTFEPPRATVTVQDGILTGIDFAATAIPTYEIAGTVTLDGIGYPQVFVNIMGPQMFMPMTDSSGHYSAMAPSGEYTIQLALGSGYASVPAFRTVTINGAAAFGQDFVVTAIPTYTIS